MSPLQFLKRPSRKDLNDVRTWLERENYEAGHSFICNWNIIEESFENSRFVCARTNRQAVAFFTWSAGTKVTTALIMAVNPDLRGQGLGSNFVQSVFSYLHSQKGILVIEAECSPLSSEPFWRRHGFVNYPSAHSEAQKYGVHLYKNLTKDHVSDNPEFPNALVELWHKKIYEVSLDEPPNQILNLPVDPLGAFIQPIAIPAESEWKVRLSIPGKLPQEDQVKYIFSRACRESGFLVGVPSPA